MTRREDKLHNEIRAKKQFSDFQNYQTFLAFKLIYYIIGNNITQINNNKQS